MEAQGSGRTRPLVVLLWSLPLVTEALEEAFDFAEVRTFAADGGDVVDLLRRVHPDAIVVDGDAAAEAAADYARERNVPVVHLSVREPGLRVLGPTGWLDADGSDLSPGTVRNALAGALFAGGAAEA